MAFRTVPYRVWTTRYGPNRIVRFGTERNFGNNLVKYFTVLFCLSEWKSLCSSWKRTFPDHTSFWPYILIKSFFYRPQEDLCRVILDPEPVQLKPKFHWLVVPDATSGRPTNWLFLVPGHNVPSVKIKIAVGTRRTGDCHNLQWTEDRLLKSVPVWGSSIGYK